MGRWRAAVVLIVLLFAAALFLRGATPDVFSRVLFPRAYQSGDVREAVRAALASLDTQPAQIHILSESADVDRRVAAALTPPLDHVQVAVLPRDLLMVDRAAQGGAVLALQEGRRYLELVGFDLEWLPQPAAAAAAFPWARVRRRLHCAEVTGDRWSPLPGVEYTGRLGVRMTPDLDGKLVFVLGDPVPLDVEAQELDGMPVPLHRQVLPAPPASGVPADFWLGDGDPWRAPEVVTRLTIAALPAREQLVSLRLGRRAPRVLARLTDYARNARVRVCAAPLGIDDAFRSADTLGVTPDAPEYFGTGWYGREFASRELGTVRWMKTRGTILVPSARQGEVEIVVVGAPHAAAVLATPAGPPAPAADAEAVTMTLSVNDVFAADPIVLKREPAQSRWRVPATAWLAATNELLFTVSRSARLAESDSRDVAFALQRLELTMGPR